MYGYSYCYKRTITITLYGLFYSLFFARFTYFPVHFFSLRLPALETARNNPPVNVSTKSHTTGAAISPVFAVFGVVGVADGVVVVADVFCL